MPTPCDNCPIRTGCDFLSGLCQLTPAQVIEFRPELVFGFTTRAKFDERQKATRLRRQKREHNRRVRAQRRQEADDLRRLFDSILTEYGTYGKHSHLMRAVRAVKRDEKETPP